MIKLSKKLQIVQYSIKDSLGNLISTFDLLTPNFSLLNYKELFIFDMQFLDTSYLNSNVISEITFLIEGAKISLIKNHISKSSQVLVNGNLLNKNLIDTLSEHLGTTITINNWKSFFVNAQNFNEAQIYEQLQKIKFENTEANPEELDNLKNQLLSNLSATDKDKVERLIDISLRIEKIDKDIASYQNQKQSKDDADKKLKDIENQANILTEKSASIKLLMENIKKIDSQLSKFGDLAANKNIVNQVQSLKEQRMSKRLTDMVNSKKTPAAIVRKAVQMGNSAIQGRELIVLAFIQLFITIILYLTSSEIQIVTLGILSLIIISISTFVLNIGKQEVNNSVVQLDDNQSTVQSDVTQDKKLDSFFINIAWVNALKSERQSLNEIVTHRLGGKNYEEFHKELQEVSLAKEKLVSEKETANKGILSSEEYYKRRREVDILRIEKENLEHSGLPQLDTQILNKVVALAI